MPPWNWAGSAIWVRRFIRILSSMPMVPLVPSRGMVSPSRVVRMSCFAFPMDSQRLYIASFSSAFSSSMGAPKSMPPSRRRETARVMGDRYSSSK